MLWALIRIASMSTHNIGFYEDLTKTIFELLSNIIKYAPYFFCCTAHLSSCVIQSEDVDFNADIHGNWTLENAKSRLHQFLQMNKILTDYTYKMVGPDHNRYAQLQATLQLHSVAALNIITFFLSVKSSKFCISGLIAFCGFYRTCL